VIGEIPFDPVVTRSMISEQTVLEYSEGIVSKEIEKIWMRIQCLIGYQPEERRYSSEEMTAIPIS
jgi:hypothetical protein